MKNFPTTEERIWAVLSHLSAVAFGLGMMLPIIGWSEQRQKSRYASFQCLQALGYQSLGYTIWLLSYFVVLIVASIFIIVISFQAGTSGQDFIPLAGLMTLMFILIFGVLGLYLILPIIAAIACGLGKDFHYPILGSRLAKYLGYRQVEDESDGLIEEHEERWLASMGHFSIIVALWGLIAPITTWIIQGRRSAFLKFQSIQTTIFQVFVNLMYLAAGVVYFLGIMMLLIMVGLGGDPGMITLFLFFLALLLAAVIMLAVPLFHILGQWAGYRVLKGDNYRYPILGKQVEKRLSKSYGAQELASASNGQPSDSTEANL